METTRTMTAEYFAHRPELDGDLFLVKGQLQLPPVPFARLIAAAPELLAALADALEALKRLPDTAGAYRVTCIQQSQNAIAKAKGLESRSESVRLEGGGA